MDKNEGSLSEFKGFAGYKIFVVGDENSGMDVSLPLIHHIALHSMVVPKPFVMYEEEDDEVNEEDIDAEMSYETEEAIPKVRSKRASLRPKWLNEYDIPKKRRVNISHRI